MRRVPLFTLPLISILVIAALPVRAQPSGPMDDAPAYRTTGLPLPRFVSLRAGEVNLRTGPGVRYPVDWVFLRRSMPVEITAEFDTWRRIRDWEGTEGWVHQSMLSGRRTAIIVDGLRTLHDAPTPQAAVVARAERGVIARIDECRPDWCAVEAQGYYGWLPRTGLWGVYPEETVE